MHYIITILPVLLFFGFLIYLDSFKLVKARQVVISVFFGAAMAFAALYINTWIFGNLDISSQTFSRYIAPLSEEFLKAMLLFILVKQKRIGFMIDAAIYGFAIGSGFAIVENVYYVMNNPDQQLMIWVVRGFGTAFMHGGATTVLGVMMLGAVARDRNPISGLLPGFLMAVLLHSVYNHFLVSPIISTLLILVLFPTLMVILFSRSEKQLQQWLEVEFHEEVKLLLKIRKGEFRDTKAGVYLESVKSKFEPEMVLDMYCYIQLYLELSIKAKCNMMLRENGLPLSVDEETESSLTELKNLRHQIGKTGIITLSPLIRMDYRDLWKLNQLTD